MTIAVDTHTHSLTHSLSNERRVSSVVEHSSSIPKVPGSILGPFSYWGHGICRGMYIAFYSWSGPQLPKGCGCIGFLSPMHKKIPIPIRKEKGATPGILVSRLYPWTVRKNSYAENEVTGKT